MKKAISKIVHMENNDMRAEYNFTGGVRGKYYKAMQAGYTLTIHKADGTTVVKDVMPKKGSVVLEPDIRAYFPLPPDIRHNRIPATEMSFSRPNLPAVIREIFTFSKD